MKELNIQVPEGYEVDKEKSTFEKIIFKKIENKLPKTWDEFCIQNSNISNEYYIGNYSNIEHHDYDCSPRTLNTDRNLLFSKEDAEAHLALIQLHRLRDVYRQGWVPNWDIYTDKWGIVYVENELNINRYATIHKFLSFQSKKIAEEFLKNFKDLIEIAKDLI
jgi:hypothetical protein